MTTKSEFVDKVAASSGLSKKDAAAAVDAVLERHRGRTQVGRGSQLHRLRQVPRRPARRPRGSQPAHGRDDDDRRQPRPALHRRFGAQEGRQVAGAMSAAGVGDGSPAPRPTFGDRLAAAVAARESQIVLGIDPDPARLWPGPLERASRARADLAQAFAAAHEIMRAVTGTSAPEPQPPALEAAAAVLVALARADRRRRARVRGRQAAARVLRAARLLRRARARGRLRPRARRRAARARRRQARRRAGHGRRLRTGAHRPHAVALRPGSGTRRRRADRQPAARPRRARAAGGRRAPRRRRRVRPRAHLEPRRRRPDGPAS